MTAHLQQALAQCPRVFAIAALLVSSTFPADAQQAATTSQGAAANEDSENTGTDFTSPVNSLEVRFQYRPSSAPGSETEKEYAIAKVTSRIELEPGWKVALLAEPEGENKVTKNSSGTTQEDGLGDSTFQAALIHDFDERWAAGAGVRAVAPTADDDLGTGKLQVMPVLGFRYSFLELGPETFIAPQMRYAVSVAGTASTRDISELQLAPLFNVDLPGRWFLTLYPSYDIRINFGPPVPGQTGQLFLPADAEIGYRLGDHIVIALEGSVPIIKDYPVYDFKTQLRIIFKN